MNDGADGRVLRRTVPSRPRAVPSRPHAPRRSSRLARARELGVASVAVADVYKHYPLRNEPGALMSAPSTDELWAFTNAVLIIKRDNALNAPFTNIFRAFINIRRS